MTERDVTYDLVEFAVKTTYDSLPYDVVEKTKLLILDTLACCVAGSSALGVKEVVELISKWNGEKESTVLIYGFKVPSLFAAFANSVMAHARDLDDTHDFAVIHCCAPILPAALSLAEYNNCNGKDLIESTAVAVEVLCRAGIGSPKPQVKGWFHTTTLGCMASSIAAGKLLGLNMEQIMNAVGISYSQFAGNQQCLIEGSLTKRIQPAFAAKTGVFSALLAAKGITGPKDVLEGPYGFYKLYLDGKYDRDAILDGLGEKFEMLNLSLKYYPSCRATHAAIDAALSLRQEENIKADQIDEVLVHVTPLTYSLAGRPYRIRENPEVDAQFSIPYTVARAFIRGDVFIDDFVDEKLRDPETIELAGKVKVLVNPELKESGAFLPLKMEVKMKNGKVYRKQINALRGSPEKPMSMEECIEKFNKCVKHSIKQLSPEKQKKIVEMISQLEKLDDISKLIELFT